MNEYDQSRKLANKSAAAAGETLEKGKTALEQSAGITLENIRNLNAKMIDMVRANTEAAFELALKMATCKTPADVLEVTARTCPQAVRIAERTNQGTDRSRTEDGRRNRRTNRTQRRSGLSESVLM